MDWRHLQRAVNVGFLDELTVPIWKGGGGHMFLMPRSSVVIIRVPYLPRRSTSGGMELGGDSNPFTNSV